MQLKKFRTWVGTKLTRLITRCGRIFPTIHDFVETRRVDDIGNNRIMVPSDIENDDATGTLSAKIDVTGIAIAMFMITAVPVALGVLIRHRFADVAARVEPVLAWLAVALFAVVVAFMVVLKA